MLKNYQEVVSFLESLQLMPKTMPGLDKIKAALEQTDWYRNIDPNKVIVVAGTNGKGTTCAALESLLTEAGQVVGFYSSPHLVSTTERIRLHAADISEVDFVNLFHDCHLLIVRFGLSHFEALTLMAGFYFFSAKWNKNPDFVILEVGLGGSFDATNAFPHKYCAITKLGIDHTNILGATLVEIAKNKFGIVSNKNIVVHHKMPEEVYELKRKTQKATNSNWIEAEAFTLEVKKTSSVPDYTLNYNNLKFRLPFPGLRAAENIVTAITLFKVLGFDSDSYLTSALMKINWRGRMQKTAWPNLQCPLFLSGDHNLQGVESLIEILQHFDWKTLHLVVGIGVDKDADQMLQMLLTLKDMKLYLTETPFKGRKLLEYPEMFSERAEMSNSSVTKLLTLISERAEGEDLVLVTGSLYLVGEVLKTQ